MTAINRTFTAPLQKEPGKSARICVVMADPAEYSGTRGLVRIRSRIDYLPFRGSFLAPGDGIHTLAVTADIRAQTGKQAGDAVTVHPPGTNPTHTTKERPMTATPTRITGIRTVSIPVDNQDAALAFYTGTLGFKVLRDNPTPDGGRWIELAAGSDNAIVTLEPAVSGVTRGAIGIRFSTDDAEAAHAALLTAGADTDDILRWPGVPAMFAFRDPDGNAFSITETA